MRLVLATVCAIGVVLSATSARAAEVTEQLSTTSAVLGEEVILTVIVSGAQSSKGPIIPQVDSMEIRSLGPPNRSSGVNYMNGKMSQWSELSFQFGVTPRKTGRLTVPSVTIRADGKEFKSRPQVLVVSRGESGPPLIVEVVTNQTEAYVEEAVRATLRVWIRVYRQDRVTLSYRDMWSLVDGRSSDFGVFGEPAYVDQRVRPDGGDSAASYYVYEKDGIIWPEKPGAIALSDVRVSMNYPISLVRDIFGNLSLQRGREVSAVPSPVRINVKPIPEDGRPADFNGAVGRYQISATAAPTDVSVGDPITLTLRVRGTGQMQHVGAPLLNRVESLTRDFKIPDEPLPGRVESDSKIFTQTIRAARTGVEEIPPIPFSYFDPQLGRFETAYSKSVAITVKAANNLSLSQVVEAEPARARSAKPLVERSEGLLANYADVPELLVQHRREIGWPSAAVLAGCPAAYLVLLFVRRRGDRYNNDSAYRRRSHAMSEAKRRLKEAHAATGPAAAAQVHAALTGYLADCLNVPHGAMTREDVRRQLTDRRVDEPVIAEMDSLLADVEMAEFAGSAAGSAEDLIGRARRALGSLESGGIR